MIKGVRKQKVVKEPRISVNNLAEYITATPTRRKKILQESKFPKEYIITRYKEARELSKKYISGIITTSDVREEIKRFEKEAAQFAKTQGAEFKFQDSSNSAESLRQLLKTPIPKFKNADISLNDEKKKYLTIKGVLVSVNPDLILKYDDALTYVGAIKLNITKSTKLTSEGQKMVCILLYEYVKKFYAYQGSAEVADFKLCQSFDVFKQQFDVCPSSMKNRLQNIEDACDEIASRWDSIAI